MPDLASRARAVMRAHRISRMPTLLPASGARSRPRPVVGVRARRIGLACLVVGALPVPSSGATGTGPAATAVATASAPAPAAAAEVACNDALPAAVADALAHAQ